jgi:hypothetical protein
VPKAGGKGIDVGRELPGSPDDEPERGPSGQLRRWMFVLAVWHISTSRRAGRRHELVALIGETLGDGPRLLRALALTAVWFAGIVGVLGVVLLADRPAGHRLLECAGRLLASGLGLG